MRCYHTPDKPEIMHIESAPAKKWYTTFVNVIKKLLGIPCNYHSNCTGIPVRISVEEDTDGFLLRQYYRNRPFELKLVHKGKVYVLGGVRVASMVRTSEKHSHYYIYYRSIR